MPKDKGTLPEKKRELITINEFADLISVKPAKARELARSRVLCDAGIAVNINTDGKSGGMRIDWPAYKDYIKTRPAVPESKRVRPRAI